MSCTSISVDLSGSSLPVRMYTGPLWAAAVPGELLPELGLALKADLRAAGAGAAAIVSLANDELGYILRPQDFRYPLNPLRPGKHYEETMSVGKTIGPAVMEAVRALIQENRG